MLVTIRVLIITIQLNISNDDTKILVITMITITTIKFKKKNDKNVKKKQCYIDLIWFYDA